MFSITYKIFLYLLIRVISSEIQTRIKGGEIAAPAQFPFEVYILYYGKFICGGTIIKPSFVITAAHCVVRYNRPVCADSIAIVAGTTQRIDFSTRNYSEIEENSQNYTFRRASHIIPHAAYLQIPSPQDKPRPFDIALIKLSTPLNYSDLIQPARLNKSPILPCAFKRVYVSGWGSNRCQRGSPTDELQYITGFECPSVYPTLFCFRTKIFVKGVGPGDSGSPMTCGSNVLVGVVSFSGIQCLSLVPVFGTNVAYYYSWINKHTNEQYN